jgi:hypothetical protein
MGGECVAVVACVAVVFFQLFTYIITTNIYSPPLLPFSKKNSF